MIASCEEVLPYDLWQRLEQTYKSHSYKMAIISFYGIRTLWPLGNFTVAKIEVVTLSWILSEGHSPLDNNLDSWRRIYIYIYISRFNLATTLKGTCTLIMMPYFTTAIQFTPMPITLVTMPTVPWTRRPIRTVHLVTWPRRACAPGAASRRRPAHFRVPIRICRVTLEFENL